MEKRRFPRVSMETEISLTIKDIKINGLIENISVCGALIRLPENNTIKNKDIYVNEYVLFYLKNDSSNIKFEGNILRIYEKDHSTFIAINFF